MLIIINIINNMDLWGCDRKNENERTKNTLYSVITKLKNTD